MLSGKVIIVTGGNGLLGRQMVRDIREKDGIAIAADVSQETDLSKSELHCDVTSLDSIKSGVDLVLKEHGRLDGLVNNAYPRTADWGTDFEELTEESLKKNVDWQLNSYILFSQQVIGAMRAGGGGSMVNVASIYGMVGNDFNIYKGTDIVPPPPYSAIKGGLINFTRFLASRYGNEGIRVNAVSPGGIFNHQPEAFVSAYEDKVPMKRMGTPEDIAPAVSFLLSDQARYITGQNLAVDGGWTAI